MRFTSPSFSYKLSWYLLSLSSSTESLTECNVIFILPSFFLFLLLLEYNHQARFIIPLSCVLHRVASRFPSGLTSQLTSELCAEKMSHSIPQSVFSSPAATLIPSLRGY